MKLTKANEGIYHVYQGEKEDSMLYRYGVFTKDAELKIDKSIELKENTLVLSAKHGVDVKIEERQSEGYFISIKLLKDERLFGLGDATRESVSVRGIRTDMYIANVDSYGPMPVLLSSEGWAFILNSTYRSIFDCAQADPDTLKIEVYGGNVDFYLIKGDSLKDLLAKVTSVTGRAEVLPKFAYGLTLVQNDQADTRSLLWDIRTARDRDISIDTMGLEPSWMAKKYDFTVDKKWNPDKFYLPSWQPANTSSDFTFFMPMRQMGMQLSLWLCNDYDLFYEADQNYREEQELKFGASAQIVDEHFANERHMDNITKPGVKWFEHLKKFVDNGAAAFKLDGANQISPHPDRLWGGKYLDKEVHNFYPVLLAKNLTEGFKEYTDRRLLLYTAGAYLGTQKYAATWAGDTGGGPATLVSLLNYAMCGHSNTACDIEIPNPLSIHYGFMVPWAQYFCWANWRFPWFMSDKVEATIRFYTHLRSALFPYTYTMAHNAYTTGMPILRPLPLVYEGTDKYDKLKNEYMYGDSVFVGAFDMHLTLPEGKWTDLFTGDVYEGGREIDYNIPEGKGGALFAKAGSVIVTMKPQKYILEKEPDYIVNVFPGADTSFTLIEDDGFTYDYRDGKVAKTSFTLSNSSDGGFTLTVAKREGGYPGRPDNGHNIEQNSIPKIDPMGDVRDMTLDIHGKKAKEILINGKPCAFTYEEKLNRAQIPADLHAMGDVTFTVRY